MEKEYKFLLSESTYNDLQKKYNWDKCYTQINYYYDTKDFDLINNGVTCRIRKKQDSLKLQVKLPDIKNSSDYASRQEIHYSCDGIKDIILTPSEVKEYTNQSELNSIGSLETDRQVFYDKDDIIVFLDKNIYLDKVDYELEIEFSKVVPNVDKILFNYKKEINYFKSLGKVERFLNVLKLK